MRLLETGVAVPAPEKNSRSNEFVSDVESDPFSPAINKMSQSRNHQHSLPSITYGDYSDKLSNDKLFKAFVKQFKVLCYMTPKGISASVTNPNSYGSILGPVSIR